MTGEGVTDKAARVTACLLLIGDEILSGRTRDANLAHIAKWLNTQGVELREARVLPDDRAVIISTLNEVRKRFDHVLTTGGIGPTHDDITAECVADAFGVPLEYNDEAARELMAKLSGPLTEGRRRMTRIPAGGAIIRNPLSGAPGFRLENVYVLAGIPQVMQAMLEGLTGTLRGGRPVCSDAVHVYKGESVIAPTLGRIQDEYPGVAMGSYPFSHDDKYGASLVMRSPDADLLAAAKAALIRALEADGVPVLDGEAPPHRDAALK